MAASTHSLSSFIKGMGRKGVKLTREANESIFFFFHSFIHTHLGQNWKDENIDD